MVTRWPWLTVSAREPKTRAEVEHVMRLVNLDARLEQTGTARHVQLHHLLDHLLHKWQAMGDA